MKKSRGLRQIFLGSLERSILLTGKSDFKTNTVVSFLLLNDTIGGKKTYIITFLFRIYGYSDTNSAICSNGSI